MKKSHPNLSVTDIQAWVGSRSFSRGQSYFRQGAIFEPRRQGMTLKARCLGSSAPSYWVEVTLDDEGIVEAECSCPVGAGGHCKHVAALLLTWLDDPQAFHESANLETDLEQRSKPELIALIRQMLKRYPDLEYLLELPSLAAGENQTAINPEIIRRQVAHAFASRGDDWGWRDPFETARDLDELLDLAWQYQEGADGANAAIIYRIVAEEILQHEHIVMGDEAGRLGGLIDACVVGLGSCLEVIQDSSARRDILQTLFNVYLWDIKMGGIGIGDRVPEILLELATPQEKELLTGWTRSALSGIREWGQEILGGLLLDLQAETLDDEEFLEICRSTGRINDLVDRLLQLGRVDEAVSESEKAGDYHLLALADIFVQHGHGSLAERLVRDRSETSRDTRLTIWLIDYAIEQGNLPEALALAQRLFWMRPSLTEYLEMKNLAIQLSNWLELRFETLEELSKNKQFGLLVEIYLEEEEIDPALEALEQARTAARYRWEFPYSLELQVARAAEKSHPEQAIRLYLNQINSLIDRRGRDHYAEAANHLKVVRELYKHLGRQEDWQTLIASLRQDNHKLRAFQDELNKAGL
jgi:uncharacterized Zn finger protein